MNEIIKYIYRKSVVIGDNYLTLFLYYTLKALFMIISFLISCLEKYREKRYPTKKKNLFSPKFSKAELQGMADKLIENQAYTYPKAVEIFPSLSNRQIYNIINQAKSTLINREKIING